MFAVMNQNIDIYKEKVNFLYFPSPILAPALTSVTVMCIFPHFLYIHLKKCIPSWRVIFFLFYNKNGITVWHIFLFLFFLNILCALLWNHWEGCKIVVHSAYNNLFHHLWEAVFLISFRFSLYRISNFPLYNFVLFYS